MRLFDFSTFFASRLSKKRTLNILSLPLDVHVDLIFAYLSVEDVLCLRRVCKSFFHLTHEPIIWKRFLQCMDIPVPPLRPSFKFSDQSTDYEIEHLVTRAVSVDNNWRSPQPRFYNNQLLLAQDNVLDMVMVPGGKYLVASMKARASASIYSLAIFDIDRPDGPKEVARTSIPFGKASNLQAKYMKYKGEDGIMIAFASSSVDQFFVSNEAVNEKQELEFGAACFHVAMNVLENPCEGSAPFSRTSYIISFEEVKILDLYEIDGVPHFAMVQEPEEIVVINLDTKSVATLACNDNELYLHNPHHITGIRVLPNQKDILVTRTVELPNDPHPPYPIYLVEMYAHPNDWENVSRDAKQFVSIIGKKYSSVQISDNVQPTKGKDHPSIPFFDDILSPISIFYQAVHVSGIDHYHVYPKQKETPTKGYDLNHVFSQSTHICQPLTSHLLPGTYRSLVYTVPSAPSIGAPPLVNLRRYTSPEVVPHTYTVPQPRESVTRTRQLIPHHLYRSFDDADLVGKVNAQGGVAAIAYDESIGRICIATNANGGIQIIDCAQAVQPDNRFTGWKQKQQQKQKKIATLKRSRFYF